MTTAFVGIGSNVGDRERFCRSAVEALRDHVEIRVDGTSSLYATSPIGGPPQRSFVNLVVRLDTELGPRALLEECQKIESRLGREPSDIK